MEDAQTEQADKARERGNKYFKKGMFAEARGMYVEAIEVLDTQIMSPAEGLKLLCLLNLAVIAGHPREQNRLFPLIASPHRVKGGLDHSILKQ